MLSYLGIDNLLLLHAWRCYPFTLVGVPVDFMAGFARLIDCRATVEYLLFVLGIDCLQDLHGCIV